MPNLDDIRLGQLSVAHGLCTPLEVEECLAIQHKTEQEGGSAQIGELLVTQGFVTRSQLTRLVNYQREAEQKVTKIGPYHLIRKLGEGGMGAVYQAKDTRTDKTVALKVLPRSRAKDKVFVHRFEQEARSAFELDHPNIVHGLDVGNADGYHYFVMEFVEGKDVYSLLEEKGRLSEPEACSIMEQIAAALDHIHGEKLVHRDIKPENILIDGKGIAKLADMGLTVDSVTQGRRRITQAGIAMGTPFYLSPEQIEGKGEADIRSDIYALGTTVYEMVTGRPPFDGESPAFVMMKHLSEQVPSPHDIDRTISLNFCHVLEKMLAKSPEDRYQTPAELIVDIKRVNEGAAPLGTRPAIGKSSVSRPRGHAQPKSEPGRNENLEKLEPMLVGAGNGSQDSRLGSAIKSKKNESITRVRPAAQSHKSQGLKVQNEKNFKLTILVCAAVILAAYLFFVIFVSKS